MGEDNRGGRTITEGFHSYSEDCLIKVSGKSNRLYVSSPIDIHIEYYSLTAIIAKCIIPKGSIYFKNIEGEFVSDRIRITDKVALYKRLVDERLGNVVRFQDIFNR